MKTVARYASLVKFSHTVFAMPFALIAYFYALWSTDTPFEWLLLVKVLLAMSLPAIRRWVSTAMPIGASMR